MLLTDYYDEPNLKIKNSRNTMQNLSSVLKNNKRYREDVTSCHSNEKEICMLKVSFI